MRLLLKIASFLVILTIHTPMYYFSLIPNKSFTIPLKHFGTFFTTIVILFTLLFSKIPLCLLYHLQDNHARPTITTAIPIANSQPDIGSNKTSKIPSPNPIKHTPRVFFKAHNISILSSYPFSLYYIPLFFYRLPIYVLYLLFPYQHVILLLK